ncbi:hypothetical protein BDM02DRAFT_3154693 [Thelephora ganbajun]|uniref:Uncharacterized protein n=1 Tax=Thelephora ganbajun TaxID=370292 RepID=A0ACB6ZMV3_THEGA|nr:hypothetical protein BDM02DRAFT_3154693 [Thelephora ganbajun]
MSTRRTSKKPRNVLAVEVLENLAKFPHCILLTRVGQFYESYFDQAAEVSQLLNIKLSGKSWGGQRILMCGFPVLHLHKYLKVLVEKNKRCVAMCEEFLREPLEGPKGGFDRRVVRIITPGTLIDEPFLNADENNYLLSVGTRRPVENSTQVVGLSWIDVSTGEFFTKDCPVENLGDELVRIAPREVVMNKDTAKDTHLSAALEVMNQEGIVLSLVTPKSVESETPSGPTRDLEPLTSTLSPNESEAVELLTTFLHDNLLEFMPKLTQPSKEFSEGKMGIDSHTVKGLEIRESMREGGATGSLLSVIKRTVTSSGSRLLARWLCSPSTRLDEINFRQSLVAFFVARPHVRDDVRQLLSGAEDATRILQRFLLGRGLPSDFSSLNSSIITWISINKRLTMEHEQELKERGQLDANEWSCVDTLLGRMKNLTELSVRITASLTRTDLSTDPEPEPEVGEEVTSDLDSPTAGTNLSSGAAKWTIRPDFSEELADLHKTMTKLLREKDALQQELGNKYGVSSLTLRSSASQGMFVHISRAKRDGPILAECPEFFHLTQTGSTRTYFHHKWAILGQQIVETSFAITAAEKKAFETLRDEVTIHAEDIRQNARLIDELDVTLGFANLAAEMNFCRPTMKDDSSYDVTNGRHPAVELGLLTSGRVFTPNSVHLHPESCLHIITGPNMAGKSTLLRQTALIAILAQTGSFVPAEKATIGIIDRLFSRIGAKDDLFRDRSTFMVEMLETAEILKHATPRSFVIMDEVGRGTTIEDGLAIAFSTVHHLSSVVQCRALFATHFHELADMLGQPADDPVSSSFGNINFYCTGVDETDDGYFSYSYKLKPGVNRDSHGLKVAHLAGMPQSVLRTAKGAFEWLRKARTDNNSQRAKELSKLGRTLCEISSPNPAP